MSVSVFIHRECVCVYPQRVCMNLEMAVGAMGFTTEVCVLHVSMCLRVSGFILIRLRSQQLCQHDHGLFLEQIG